MFSLWLKIFLLQIFKVKCPYILSVAFMLKIQKVAFSITNFDLFSCRVREYDLGLYHEENSFIIKRQDHYLPNTFTTVFF